MLKVLQSRLKDNIEQQNKAIERNCAIRLERLQNEQVKIQNQIKSASVAIVYAKDYRRTQTHKAYFINVIDTKLNERVCLVSDKSQRDILDDAQAVYDICLKDTKRYKRG